VRLPSRSGRNAPQDGPASQTEPKWTLSAAGIGALPVLDARAPEEILGYDAFGIPG